MTRSSERGIAIIIAMFMVLITSVIGTSMMATARTETISTVNYRTTSQARYAAESGIATAINYLLWNYTLPCTGCAGDPISPYDMTKSPVEVAGAPAVFSSDPDVPANYPIQNKDDAFAAATAGSLDLGNGGTTNYVSSATLVSMFEFTDVLSGQPRAIQTWRITGVGSSAGLGGAEVSIEAVMETPIVPLFSYAAFGTGEGCDILNFSGGGSTGSYDSTLGVTPPAVDDHSGSVGTNGNLSVSGSASTIVNGTLSTPKAGVGNCTQNNVTALTLQGKGSVSEGLIELPQDVEYDDPEEIDPTPPTTNQSFTGAGGCPAGVSFCAASANGATITPTTSTTVVSMGNVSVNGGADLHLNAGIYEINSISLNGGSTLYIDSGPVIFHVEGDGVTTPISLNGGNISNGTYVSSDLEFVYGGTGEVKLNGGSGSSALVYAPNADVEITGSANFYGAVVGGTVDVSGGAKLVYDRALQNDAFKAGNPTLTSFNWESF